VDDGTAKHSCLLGASALTAARLERSPPASCEDLVVAAQATSSGDVLGTLTNDDISCGPLTVFEIAQNRLKLVGDTSKVVHFYNARFVVGGSGVLRADVPVDLTGDNLPDSVSVCPLATMAHMWHPLLLLVDDDVLDTRRKYDT